MIFILLPAYNEGSNIVPLLGDIVKHAPEWETPVPMQEYEQDMYPVTAVVVDDGSSDNTAAETESFQGPINVVLLKHEKNKGLAAALKTGLDYIANHASDFDYVITMDADCTHKPDYIKRIIDQLDRKKDIVVASRYAPGGVEHGVSQFRLFLSRGAKFCYRIFFPTVPLNDFSCGFRGFRARILKQVLAYWKDKLFQTQGFTCTGELMLKSIAFTTPDRVTEVPFELHYELKGGVSKMPAIKTTLSTLSMLFKARSWIKPKTVGDIEKTS